MPDGLSPTQFVAMQLESTVAPPGESVESSGADAMTGDIDEEYDIDGMCNSCIDSR